MRYFTIVHHLVLIALSAAVLSGCGNSDTEGEARLKSANPTNIHRLTNLYSLFAQQNGGCGPKDEKQFREFIGSIGPERLGRIGIDANGIDAVFTSERDSKPFIIRYASKAQESRDASPAEKGGAGGTAVVLEAEGVDGKRQVGFLGTRQVKTLDKNEASKLD